MARCEDYPACQHEPGCCPDYDPETGRQLNMRCTCGATVPIDSPWSICEGCMHDPECPGCDSPRCAYRLSGYDDDDDPDLDGFDELREEDWS